MIIVTKVKTKARRSGKPKPAPLRQCALTKRLLPSDELIRFVLSPEQIVTPDLRCKLPGRGLWLSADRASVNEAVKKKLFARGFRQKAFATNDLADMIEKLARIEALHTLSLANKAGLVITGYEKVKRALARGDVKWILHAEEASRNGSDKLDRFFLVPLEEDLDDDGDLNEEDLDDEDEREPFEGPLSDETDEQQGDSERLSGILPSLFNGDELSLALGRPNVIHIGLKPGEMARRFSFALRKSAAFVGPEQEKVPVHGDRT